MVDVVVVSVGTAVVVVVVTGWMNRCCWAGFLLMLLSSPLVSVCSGEGNLILAHRGNISIF